VRSAWTTVCLERRRMRRAGPGDRAESSFLPPAEAGGGGILMVAAAGRAHQVDRAHLVPLQVWSRWIRSAPGGAGYWARGRVRGLIIARTRSSQCIHG
jgi:hypothetical protein